MGIYPVQYIKSLESQLSGTRQGTDQERRSMPLGQLENDSSRLVHKAQRTNALSNPGGNGDEIGMDFMATLSTPGNAISGVDMLQYEGNLFSNTHVFAPDETTTSHLLRSDTTMPVDSLGQGTVPTVAEVSINEGALFFQTYFEAIHPRYPFLDVEECSLGYQEWKTGDMFMAGSSPWRSYLVKLVRK